MNASDLQAAARETYAASVTAGEPLAGAELARQYGRSPTWGLARIAEVRTRTNGSADPHQSAVDEVRPDQPSRDQDGHPQRRPWWVTAITMLVALVAAAASYGHQLEVAQAAGEPDLIAHAVPLTVDGLVVAALWAGERGRWWLRLALAVSVAANVAAAEPTTLGYAVAGWPPLALYGCDRLLHGGRK